MICNCRGEQWEKKLHYSTLGLVPFLSGVQGVTGRPSVNFVVRAHYPPTMLMSHVINVLHGVFGI